MILNEQRTKQGYRNIHKIRVHRSSKLKICIALFANLFFVQKRLVKTMMRNKNIYRLVYTCIINYVINQLSNKLHDRALKTFSYESKKCLLEISPPQLYNITQSSVKKKKRKKSEFGNNSLNRKKQGEGDMYVSAKYITTIVA